MTIKSSKPVLGIAKKLGWVWRDICCTQDEYLKIMVYLDRLRKDKNYGKCD